MGFPNFLIKSATAASQVLQRYDKGVFEQILMSQYVCVGFDNQAVSNKEGADSLDLAVRLLARLYPNLEIRGLTVGLDEHKLKMESLARSINPDINLVSNPNPTIFLVVGASQVITDEPVFYLGSDNWLIKFSTSGPIIPGNSNNPLAAGAAACFGVANIFRHVFKDHLPGSRLDTSFCLSLIDYQLDSESNVNPPLSKFEIGCIHLAGLGAIGNSFIWALGRTIGLQGELKLIDKEAVDLSNLQRYVLTDQNSIGQQKTIIGEDALKESKLVIESIPDHWGGFVESMDNWFLEKVAVAVDSAEDRIFIQSSLPKVIYNSWTQTNDLGVSRHPDFINKPCLACLYLPKVEKLHFSQEVAQNLGLINPQDEEFIRGYLAQNLPVDQAFVEKIAIAKGIPVLCLTPYIGEHVQIFYNKMICGGMLMDISNETVSLKNVEVPLAFQSALAGILLATEVILDSENIRPKQLPTRTRFNLLKSISKHNSEDCDKLDNSNCLCQDADYQEIYSEKYNLKD